MHRTAGIIIIGNEILSGKFRDGNTPYLINELRALGTDVRRVSVIPDDPDEIGKEAVTASERFDFVLTTGGIGPTHDDVTMQGIAKGFGVRLVRHPDLESHFMTHYRETATSVILKMADVPEGAEVVQLGSNRFPLVTFRNIFIFPGIPDYLRVKFEAVRERFRSEPFYLKKLFLKSTEPEIAEALNRVVSKFSGVSFGSYPVLNNAEYAVIVTAESADQHLLEQATSAFSGVLSAGVLVRTESVP